VSNAYNVVLCFLWMHRIVSSAHGIFQILVFKSSVVDLYLAKSQLDFWVFFILAVNDKL